MQIGEVASRTGLSLRTIRYYEELGLLVPSARSAGGFRLYTDADVARLELVKGMKPLDFPLDDVRRLLEVLDALEDGASGADREHLLAGLEEYRATAEERIERLRRRLRSAEEFADGLARLAGDHRNPSARS